MVDHKKRTDEIQATCYCYSDSLSEFTADEGAYNTTHVVSLINAVAVMSS